MVSTRTSCVRPPAKSSTSATWCFAPDAGGRVAARARARRRVASTTNRPTLDTRRHAIPEQEQGRERHQADQHPRPEDVRPHADDAPGEPNRQGTRSSHGAPNVETSAVGVSCPPARSVVLRLELVPRDRRTRAGSCVSLRSSRVDSTAAVRRPAARSIGPQAHRVPDVGVRHGHQADERESSITSVAMNNELANPGPSRVLSGSSRGPWASGASLDRGVAQDGRD